MEPRLPRYKLTLLHEKFLIIIITIVGVKQRKNFQEYRSEMKYFLLFKEMAGRGEDSSNNSINIYGTDGRAGSIIHL